MKFRRILLLVMTVFTLPYTTYATTYRITEDAFGANIHLRQRIASDDWNTVLDKAEDAKIKWGREEFSWEVIEPANDQYSWEAYDNVVQTYEDHNMKMVGLLTYSTAWASSNPGSTDYEFYPPDADLWKEYVAQVAERYKGKVDYWEIWNEPNHSGFWKGSVEDYARLFDATYDAIKEVNPDAHIIVGGLSGADADYLDQVYDNIADPTHIEVVAIHPYRVKDNNFNYAPERTIDGLNTLYTDVYNIKAVMGEHGQNDVPIWFTETGWTTYSGGVTEQEQAEYLMRLYSIGLSLPNVQKIFWYSMNDVSSNESYLESQFGLMNHDFTTKLAFDGHKFVVESLLDAKFRNQILPQYRIIDNFVHSQHWQFSSTVCTDGTLNDTSGGVMTVHYHFTQVGNCYAPIALRKRLPRNTQALQFQAKGNSDDTLLRMRVTDKTGETFQYNLGYMPKEWLPYTVQLKQFSAHWGGDNDAKLDLPLTFDSFILDNTDGSTVTGSAQFDELYSSPKPFTYLYRFTKDQRDLFAFWTAGRSRNTKLNLLGAKSIRERIWNNGSPLHESSKGDYTLRAEKSVKFLREQ